ncbi:MAG TPA: Crp/Fnr family transcriptional regulator [Candidatus Eisenbacteria bacterium]|jgi:CRP/FNR family transcriptional regulator|nr:Crp/Fnr family transcriptional regulator [Candidatus Eisenbacteria bacterium]
MPFSLKDIPFFEGLSEKEVSLVKECLREKSFEKGQTLFLEGASCERVFFVKTGRVKLYRIGPSGREQTLETLGPGDTCACNPGETQWHCSSTAQAMVPSTVWFLSREHYVRLVRDDVALARRLNRLFAKRLQCFSMLIEGVSLLDSKKRVAKFLLDLPGTAEGPGKDVLDLPFTREELAQRIGLARETVARQLYELKRLKLIDIRGRQIVVRDRPGLKKILEK